MLYLEEKYLRLLSPQLERFHSKSAHTFNFRCPLCGDSERMRSKARGYVYAKQTKLMFKCHNCGLAMPFLGLLKKVSPRLYDEFMLEKVRENGKRPTEAPPAAPADAPSDVLRSRYVIPLDRIRLLGGALYPVFNYANGRDIPYDAMPRLYATRRAYSWILPLVGEEKAKRVEDETLYLVMPMALPTGEWFGAQLRTLDKKDYVTFRWHREALKVFGLDAWTPTETTYIVEGPLDSLFVPNALAIMGSDLLTGVSTMETALKTKLLPDRTVFVWDAEPRNKDVCRHMRNAIRLQKKVVIWPQEVEKDINDMFRAGRDVLSILKQRTFQGLRAELEFAAWHHTA